MSGKEAKEANSEKALVPAAAGAVAKDKDGDVEMAESKVHASGIIPVLQYVVS